MRFSQEAILKSNEDSLCAPNVENGVIGRLKVSPHWICQSGGDIYALNHHRFEEVAIFDRLLGSRTLNTVDLPEPKVLDDDKSWNGALNETLLNMPRAEAGLVTDERVRTNGFAVKVRKDGLGGILVGVPRDVNFMGPAELSVSILDNRIMLSLILTHLHSPFWKASKSTQMCLLATRGRSRSGASYRQKR